MLKDLFNEKTAPFVFFGVASLLFTIGVVVTHHENLREESRIVSYTATVDRASVRILTVDPTDPQSLERCSKALADILGVDPAHIKCTYEKQKS